MAKKNKKYWFIIAYLIVEIILKVVLSYTDINGFAVAPYIRLGILFFTVVYFLVDVLNIKFDLTTRVDKVSSNSLFVYGWFVFSMFSIIIGIINRNPTLYVITDFIYLFLGALLYYITEIDTNYKSHLFSIKSMSNMTLLMAVICIISGVNPPALLLIIIVIIIYLNLLRKRILQALILLVPYMILVVVTNRTQLIVFLLMILILFLKRTRKHLSLKTVVLSGASLVFLVFLLKNQLLDFVLLFIDKNSNLGFRIYQVSVIFNEGIDFNNPFFVSISQRIVECQVVISQWTSSIGNFIFGLGSGATIDGSVFYSDKSVLSSALLGSDKIHNIHLLPFAMIFRYGLIGLLLFLVLIKIVYKSFVCVLNESKNMVIIFWNLFVIFWFFFSIPAASFLWSMPLFWISLSIIKNNTNEEKSV